MLSKQVLSEADQKRANMKEFRAHMKLGVKKIGQENQKERLSPEENYKKKLKQKEGPDELKKFTLLSKLKQVFMVGCFQDIFEQKEKLGEGAHSSVYRCIEKSTGNVYAAKFFKRIDSQLVTNIKQTYQVIKNLHHSSIAQGKYLFISNNQHSCQLITQYIPYEDLRSFIKKLGKQIKLTQKSVVTIIDQILKVLQYLQEQGVCHRDIKPENILYNEETGEIKLIDFQLCRVHRYVNQKIELWSNTGSLHYRAPESFTGGYNEKIDMWAVGIITFELLLGHLPFNSKYDKKVIQKICQEQLNFQEFDLSLQAANFLCKILCKNPAHRLTPKQARRHPFILKNSMKLKGKPSFSQNHHEHNTSFQVKTPKSVDQSDQTFQSKCYDQDAKFTLSQCLTGDIGIRICSNQ